MKVYVLLDCTPYEGCDIINIFLDESRANEVKEQYKNDNYYDTLIVREELVIE